MDNIVLHFLKRLEDICIMGDSPIALYHEYQLAQLEEKCEEVLSLYCSLIYKRHPHLLLTDEELNNQYLQRRENLILHLAKMKEKFMQYLISHTPDALDHCLLIIEAYVLFDPELTDEQLEQFKYYMESYSNIMCGHLHIDVFSKIKSKTIVQDTES